jgi:hypothetical protein
LPHLRAELDGLKQAFLFEPFHRPFDVDLPMAQRNPDRFQQVDVKAGAGDGGSE